LTCDGRFTYLWDAENRLIAMETLASVPVIARCKLAFGYDALGRRIRKATWNGTASGTWQPQLDLRFVHQLGGWNLLAEITADNKFLRSYTWGSDLSGSLSGAGGVGGLLFTKIHPDNSIHANGMDLNGNVSLLVSTTTGQATATYDYGPFGEPLRESGEYAKLNPYRFSTKYTDDETGLLDYGLRYYIPSTGRWLNRDPIGEMGGVNLYGMVENNAISRWDLLGLASPACIEASLACAEQGLKLIENLAKYNPIEDAKGNHPFAHDITTPGGHYKEIKDLQRGLRNKLKHAYKMCKDDDDKPDKRPMPYQQLNELANRSITAPHGFPPESGDRHGIDPAALRPFNSDEVVIAALGGVALKLVSAGTECVVVLWEAATAH
jgi:RHS repeat-associated protein